MEVYYIYRFRKESGHKETIIMAKLLLTGTFMDHEYKNGEFRYFPGDAGAPANVDLPLSILPNFIGSADPDPVVRSYMGSDGNPRALVCIVTTTSSGTSTGKYFIYKADLSGGAITWSRISPAAGMELRRFMLHIGGNPYGVAQAGNFLYINDYDTKNIYTIDIADFEMKAARGDSFYRVIADTPVTVPAGKNPHGVSLIALTGGTPSATYLYDLHAFESGYVYDASQVTRFTVGANGVLTDEVTVDTFGKNAQALVPVPDGSGGFTILVPAIGGYQNAGSTNGSDSTLHRVNAFGAMAETLVLTGDGGSPTPTAPAITTTGNYDIKSVAVSASGGVWLLLVSKDANYKSWWRLFKTTMTQLLAFTDPKTLAAAISAGDLTPLDSGLGSPGNYWEVLFENSAGGPGRLWFVAGTPIRVSAGDNYDNKVLFDEGVLYAKDPDPDVEFPYIVNLNSADLIGEMIYQYALGHSIDTRLIKGKAATPAATTAAEEEEEEK
jgi:hypothetical protein